MAADSAKNGRGGVFNVLTKLAVSVGFGLAALGIALVFDKLDGKVEPAKIVGIGISIFVAGVAFVTQFLIDVEIEVGHTRALVKEELSKVNAASRMLAKVEASVLRTETMTQLIAHATGISPDRPPLVFKFAEAEIDRLSRYLRELGQGTSVTYHGEDRDWLLGLTRVVGSNIDATSLSSVDGWGQEGSADGGLWNSDLGWRYLEAQREAIRRGVTIRRIFIVDLPDVPNPPDFTAILRLQAEHGIKVRTLRLRPVSDTQRMLFDFIVMDGVLSYEPRIASGPQHSSPIVVSTTLYTDEAWVSDRIQRYEELWNAGEDFVLPEQPGVPAPQPT